MTEKKPTAKPRKHAGAKGGARNPGGRPTSYREEFGEQAYKLCLLGATDEELGDFFGVSKQTINAWKSAHPKFLDSITRGKVLADANVAEKLYERACGYSHQAVKMFQAGGQVISEDYTEHYPPDTQAASLWLRNRQSSKWRDKQEIKHEGGIEVTRIERVVVEPK